MSDAENNLPVKILLVGDDRLSLLNMEYFLTGPDRIIFKTESGQAALRFALEHEFAVILLDTVVPKMDGFEAALLIRQCERNRQAPIIFISEIDMFDEDVKEGFSQGIVDFIFKPIIPKVLKSKVDVFIDRFRQASQGRNI